jgi:hypothetical protein
MKLENIEDYEIIVLMIVFRELSKEKECLKCGEVNNFKGCSNCNSEKQRFDCLLTKYLHKLFKNKMYL